MSILSVIKRIRQPFPRPAPLSEAKKRQMAAKKKRLANMAQGKRAQLKKPIKKSKPTSTAREKYIASKAIKPKAKSKTIRSPHKK